ncbi:MAG: alpha/beta hydrolase [Pseudonocardiaceae bacterium]
MFPGALPECGGELGGFSHHSVEVNRVRLHYVIGGQGPAVVLLHGFPETWWTWRQVMPLLAQTHTVIAPDLRGIGCSSLASAGYDAQTLAQDVHELVASLGLPRVALVGHDLGGWAAYAYARQYRDQVSHLVLVRRGASRLWTRATAGLPPARTGSGTSGILHPTPDPGAVDRRSGTGVLRRLHR